jgi:predicted dehydrogenase
VAKDFAHVPRASLIAVASRSTERAEAFATEHGVERAYGSYSAIMADPDVDVIYIATPHPQHLQVALAAIAAGKAVLVEKTFTATVAGAEELVGAARAAGVFAMEAMWTRFQPAIVEARRLVDDGAMARYARCRPISVSTGPTTRRTGFSTRLRAAVRSLILVST